MHIDDQWDDLFSPEFDPTERADINAHIDLLEKLRSISSHLVRQEIIRPQRYDDQSSELTSMGAISAMLRRLVEILNSVISSIKAGQLTGASIQVRPAIELLAELAFLLQDSNEISHRVRCYMMMELHNEKQMLEDCKGEFTDTTEMQRIDGRILELEEKLKLPYFGPIRSDFTKLTKSGNQEKWYTLATFNKTRYDEDKKKQVSAKITSIKWLMANLSKEQRKAIKYLAFALLSNSTHSSNLLPQSIGLSEQKKPILEPIGKATPADYRDFIRAVVVTFTPVVSIIMPFRTPTQRKKISDVWEDFMWHYNRLYNPKSTIREDPFFQIQHLRSEKEKAQLEAQRITEQTEAAEAKILKDHAESNRKYPVGHEVIVQNKLCTLGDANAFIEQSYLGINYAVLLDGAQIDTLDERSVKRSIPK